MPGEYSVEMYLVSAGEVSQLVDPVAFKATLLDHATLPAKDPAKLVEFQKEVSELSRVMTGTRRLAQEQLAKLTSIKKAIKQTPGTGMEIFTMVQELEQGVKDILFTLEGPQAKASWQELPPMQMPLNRRLSVMIRTHWSSTSELTKTETDQLEILKEEFPPVLIQLEEIVEKMVLLEDRLEELKAPWTPGRVPELE